MLFLSLLLGCSSSYTLVTDIGGEMTLSIAPVGGAAGLTTSTTRAGMTTQELDESLNSGELLCSAPRMAWALDSLTEEPVSTSILACFPEVEASAPAGCGSPYQVDFDLDEFLGLLYVSADPVGNGAMGDQISTVEIVDFDAPLSTNGSLTFTADFTGDCLGGIDAPVPHEVTMEWDFPIHDERTISTPFDWSTPSAL